MEIIRNLNVPLDRFLKFLFAGVGGYGCLAAQEVSQSKIKDDLYTLAIDTSAESLIDCTTRSRVQIGTIITVGNGCGTDPGIGRESAEYDIHEVRNFLNSDIVFLSAGLGRGCGAGALPVYAREAKARGALVVIFVTMPFGFEGISREDAAIHSLNLTRKYVDAVILIDNNSLLKEDLLFRDIIKKPIGMLINFIEGLSYAIKYTGIINNFDFAELKRFWVKSGFCIVSSGEGIGDSCVEDAISQVIKNPLGGYNFSSAKRLLICVAAGEEFTLPRLKFLISEIYSYVSKNCDIRVTANINEDFNGKVKITTIAADIGYPIF